jgi:fumarate reductase iron-sulfur subunit
VRRVASGGRLELRPLENLPVIKDLAVDMSDFFGKWSRAHGAFAPAAGLGEEFAKVAPDSPERQAASAGIECIGCGVCYAACDVVRWNDAFLGPAALNRAWTLVNDCRDGDGAARLRAVAGDAGCHACHSQQSCVLHCPKQLDPTAAIAGLKRATAKAALWGKL